MKTQTELLETLHLRGFSIEDLMSVIDPNFLEILETVKTKGGTLGDLLCIIYSNNLPRNFDIDDLEEKVENHYEI